MFVNRGSARVLVLVGGLGLILTGMVQTGEGNERHFTYSHESAVLAPGAREFEMWTTYRTGRPQYYTRMDYRAEFEMGLTDRLMTAFYLNWRDVAQANDSNTAIDKQFEFEGISSEWKFKMTDPVADKVGSALYGEFSLGTDELAFEGKLIFDKRVGKNLFAYNFVAEPEWEREVSGGLAAPDVEINNSLGATHFFRPDFGAGLELNNINKFTNDHSPEYCALFLGPVISYATEKWWVAFTALAQLPALKPSANNPSSTFVTDDQERYNVRLLFSLPL
jgi:hypothetical protein